MVRTCHPRRAGFTLIELLVVILIVGILIALLLPAITGAVGTARNAQVTAEITQLATALEDFKSKYGEYPPSRIVVMENGNYTSLSGVIYTANATDISLADLSQRTLRSFRKFFPRATGYGGDLNGNGQIDTTAYVLQGHECLVFFLGGIPSLTVSGDGTQVWELTGFSKNPVAPFASATASSNRQAPFFEFKAERLVDENGNGVPGYVDPLGTNRFYAYFASYGSGSYDPNDVNFPQPPGTAAVMVTNESLPGFAEEDSAGVRPIAQSFKVKFPLASGGFGGTPNFAQSPVPNPYTNGPSAFAAPNAAKTPTWHKPESFQIISAGRDGLYGPGGEYLPSSDNRLPYNGTLTTSKDAGVRLREADNLTNFAAGRLE